MKVARILIVVSLSILLSLSVLAQSEDTAKQSLTHDVYDGWKSINASLISNDGKWISYLETPQDGNAEIVMIHSVDKTEYRHTIGYSGEGTDSERAAKPQFTQNSGHIAFIISPSQEEVKAAKKKNKGKKNAKLKKKLCIMDLSDGTVHVIDSVKSFQLPKKADGWVAYLKEKPEEKKEDKKKEDKKAEEKEKSEEKSKDDKKDKKKKTGTPLVLLALADNSETTFPWVIDYKITKNGKHLFFNTSSKDSAVVDGVYRFDTESGSKTTLLSGKGDYKKWTLNKKESTFAFVTNRDDYEAHEPTFNLYGGKIDANEALLWVSHTSTQGFPDGLAVSDKSDIKFSDDGAVVMFGIKEIPEEKADDDSADVEEKAKFDLWHWNDPYPQPQQKLMAKDVRNNTWESVYHFKKKKFVRLADKTLPDVTLNRTGKIAFGQTNWPHSKKVSFYGSFNDVYIVDVQTGKKTLVKEHLFGYRGARMSPYGKYVAWFEGKDWFVYNVRSGSTVNLTEGMDERFEREDHDRPEPPSSYGIAGWTKDDKSILIYDRYDIWQFSPDGKTKRRITEGFGRENDLSFRYEKLNPNEVAIDPAATLLLNGVDQNTMDEGFYHDKVDGTDKPKQLLTATRAFSTPKKAKKADKLILTRYTFEEYPDLWLTDINISKMDKITNLGSQMDPFIWGTSELRDFKSADGKPLKGILVKPDNFDPGKKYPLMVYIYETLHTRRHSFRNPSPGSSVNPAYYVSNGYVLWMPDIEYDTGYPGQDAMKCVLPGIQMLIREGYIDQEAIGIQGHSWGGYQIAYMITRTNIFAAAEAGAPVSNMTSAYGGIRWASGMVRQFQYEMTQSRQGASLWEVPLRYMENSPLFWADKVQTPLMMMHNDEDGAVPWYQGIEYIMALRRLEKEAYMFNYNGEKHGLRKRVNQKDWTIRMAEFFDHHLKGAPKPDWMTNGIKAWEKEEDKKE